MEWIDWERKFVFVRTGVGKVYSGVVQEVADIGDGVIFISLIDKFDNWVTLAVKEIVEIKEEKENVNK